MPGGCHRINIGSSVAACLGHRRKRLDGFLMRRTMQNNEIQEKQTLSAKHATEKRRHTAREAKQPGVVIGSGFLALP